jgi:hypothetical protein
VKFEKSVYDPVEMLPVISFEPDKVMLLFNPKFVKDSVIFSTSLKFLLLTNSVPEYGGKTQYAVDDNNGEMLK